MHAHMRVFELSVGGEAAIEDDSSRRPLHNTGPQKQLGPRVNGDDVEVGRKPPRGYAFCRTTSAADGTPVAAPTDRVET